MREPGGVDAAWPLAGIVSGGVHRYRLRVFYEDTDAGGIVYHANYLRFAERARSEFLRLSGVDHSGLLRRDGVGFAVRRCTIDFQAPARLDDLLEVTTAPSALRGAAVDLRQSIHRVDGAGTVQRQALVELALTIACINAAGRPVRLPASVRSAFAGAGPSMPDALPAAS